MDNTIKASLLTIVWLGVVTICGGAGQCGGGGGGTVDALPPAPPVVQTTCQAACANLAGLGCSEAYDLELCGATCQKAQDGKITDLKPAKLAAAQTVGDVQAVGTVECTADESRAAPATCSVACANVRRFGCSEGPTCLAECTRVTAARLVDLHLACLGKARTKLQLQACKSVSCR